MGWRPLPRAQWLVPSAVTPSATFAKPLSLTIYFVPAFTSPMIRPNRDGRMTINEGRCPTQPLGLFACHERKKWSYRCPKERSFIATPQRYWPEWVFAAMVAAGAIAVVTAVQAQSVDTGPAGIAATASTNAAAATAEEERVIVTGSHIPTAAEVGPNPVIDLDRDYIEKAPERTAEQLLKDLPVANANGVPLSNNGTGAAPGASSISLRGFDPSATLVLINGRRVAPYPIGAGGTQTFVDLNTIPRAAIESIEILKDGASTTYGADAVAGVVNIKFRQDYRGAETQLEYGNTLDKDNGELAASLLFGAGDDTVAVTGLLNYYHRNDIFNRDRAFSNFAIRAVKSTASNPGQFIVTPEAALAAGVPADQLPDGSSFVARPPKGSNGLAPPVDYSYYPRPPQHLFNFNAFASSFPKAERYGGFADFHDKICGDQLVAYGDFFQETARNRYELAPATVTFQGFGLTTVAIPPHAPGATLGGPTYEETELPLAAFNPFNPFQQIISGRSRYRLVDFPNRIVDDESDAFMSTLGLKGDKLFDGSWGYDAGFRYSEVTDAATGNEVSRSRFNRTLNAADPIFDPTSPEFIGTTVPYNPFGDYHKPIPTNAAAIGFATVHPNDLLSSKLTTLDLNIYTTSLFKLPAGPVGLAFGGQFRRENITQDPDEQEIAGDILSFSKAVRTVAGRKSFGIYAEIIIPLLSPEMGVPGLHLVEFTASGRFEDFLNNNTNILVPKVGLRWQPFDDSLTLRATWGEGFREPSLFELFNSPILFGSQVTDRRNPGGPATVFPVDTLLTSNPNLQPEDSRNFNAGVVYTPRFVPNLTASVDYFVIERHAVVGVPNPQDILRREGHLFPGEAVIRDPDGFLSEIIGPYENNGGQRATGFDFALQYQLHTSFGTWTSLNQATYLDSFRLAISPRDPALELRSQSTAGDQDAFLKWKGRSRVDWSWKGFTLSGTVQYIDGFHEILFAGRRVAPDFPDFKKEHWVHQTFTFDGQASYEFKFVPMVPPTAGVSTDSKSTKQIEQNAQAFEGSFPCWKKFLDNTTLTIGCNNIFGQDPPRAIFSAQNYPGFIYDSVGRFVYVRVTKKF